MKTLRSFSFAFALAASALLTQGCETTTTGERFNMLSTEQEKQLGAELSAQVEQQEKVLANPALQAYVRGIGERLSRYAPRQDVAYQFTVIDNPESVNAFALPGGHLYVYTGLMKLCTNEAELASVMAHEIAHVAAKHHGETLTRQYGIELLLGVISGDNPRMGAQIVAGLVSMGYNRGQEREADAIGMNILFQAGYQPEAMVTFMEKMYASEQAQGGGRPPALLSTHPATTQRIANLSAQTAQYPLDIRQKSPVYAERYQQEVLRVLK